MIKKIHKYIKIRKASFILHQRYYFYSLIALAAIVLLTLSFFLEGNWPNVFCGVGTGLITSLAVSIIINFENDARLKRKLIDDKRFLLNDIVHSCKDVYIDLIYRINEYIMFENGSRKSIYEVYNNYEPVMALCVDLGKLDLTELTDEKRSRLEELFNIRNYHIDYLISELKQFSKHEYYLKGLLTRKEFEALASNNLNDRYIEYATHINEFWDDKIIDIKKCIQFMRLTLFICTKIINAIEDCKSSVKIEEKKIEDTLDQRYYDEIYTMSEEYIEKQIEEDSARQEYYENHLDELAMIEQFYAECENETLEDRLIKDLYCCICGFSAYTIDDLLDQADANSKKMLSFILQENVQHSIRFNWKKRKAVKKKFGSNKEIKLRLAKTS